MSTAPVQHPALLFISEAEMISVIVVTVGTTEANTCQSVVSLPGWNFPFPTQTGLNQAVGHTAEWRTLMSHGWRLCTEANKATLQNTHDRLSSLRYQRLSLAFRLPLYLGWIDENLKFFFNYLNTYEGLRKADCHSTLSSFWWSNIWLWKRQYGSEKRIWTQTSEIIRPGSEHLLHQWYGSGETNCPSSRSQL